MLVIGERGLAPSRILAIGAHADDLEIGCGGTVLALLERRAGIDVDWLVLSADDQREREARDSARRLLVGAGTTSVIVERFRERYFPYDAGLKEYFDGLGARSERPELVLVPWAGDAHQDHRTLAELAAATFRDALILEYEIPKIDGDIGRPSVYVQLTAEQAARKVAAVMDGFPSQRDRHWFTEDTFRAVLRLRGIESRSPSGFAEAFHCRKLVLA